MKNHNCPIGMVPHVDCPKVNKYIHPNAFIDAHKHTPQSTTISIYIKYSSA